MKTDLDETPFPHEIPQVLRNAAQLMREQASDLQSAWGDPQAGLIWSDFAKILERAATSCDTALARRDLSPPKPTHSSNL